MQSLELPSPFQCRTGETPFFLQAAISRDLPHPLEGGFFSGSKKTHISCPLSDCPASNCGVQRALRDLCPILLGFKATKGGRERGNDPRQDGPPAPYPSLERPIFSILHLGPGSLRNNDTWPTGQNTLVPLPALSLTGCVTSDKLLNLSGPQLLRLERNGVGPRD